MRNLFGQQRQQRRRRNAPVSTEAFLRALLRHLRRHLPPDEASEIVAETGAHLAERRDTLRENGLAAESAEAESVAGFGDPRRYARDAARGVYETRQSRLAWPLGGLFCLLTFGCFALVGVVGYGCLAADTVTAVLFCASVALATVVFGVCAYHARRRHIKLVLVAGAAVYLLTAVWQIRYSQTMPSGWDVDTRYPEPILTSIDAYPAPLRCVQNLLDEGVRVYGSGASIDPRAIPADLKSKGAFIVPRPILQHDPKLSPFIRAYLQHNSPADLDKFHFSQEALRHLDSVTWQVRPDRSFLLDTEESRDETVKTAAEAQRAWRQRGPYWQERARRDAAVISADRAFIQRYRKQARPAFAIVKQYVNGRLSYALDMGVMVDASYYGAFAGAAYSFGLPTVTLLLALLDTLAVAAGKRQALNERRQRKRLQSA